MNIDPQYGTIRFSNGALIEPIITQEDFRSKPVLSEARSQDYGTLPWIHYHFSGGQTEGRELLASVCFYDQLLIDVKISANFYPLGNWDWSHYSLEVEAETKHFHDQLLNKMLGKPNNGGWFFRRIPHGLETLQKPLQWKFKWGNVFSGHDWKGGDTAITVNYGNRGEEAHWAYKRRTESH